MTRWTGTIGPGTTAAAALARCLACTSALGGRDVCPRCGRHYPERDGIWEAIGPLTGTNRIAAAFYDGPDWPRFRPWERLFLGFQGGPRRARRSILRYLPGLSTARVLEVGIGDGENLPWLPPGWETYGVDISRTQLAACRDRFPSMRGRLVWAEGEALPFEDGAFDAAYSVGGFNYFRDHRAALREMRRVTRAGGPVIVADEVPHLYRYAPGSVLGFERLDRWALRAMGLNADFLEMVYNHRIDVDALARAEWPRHRRFPIWSRLGYCLVDPDPTTTRGPEACR
jgi:SAM-dependent methyltransferase